ncbi:MAG: hypothetical protein QG588_2305, partial [Candidatus Poribacteria bacterium]|nr:hypothetical protein [Candidatus Poribacteria bacterium]
MMIKIFAKSRKGLTFIELLLVVSIIAIVGTAGVLSFRSGRNTWGNADNQTQVIQNAVVGMEKVVREIKNSPGIVYFDSAINGTKMRLKVLRNDGSGTYVEQYAMFKRDGNYLQYGERATDSATEADWTLNNLAYPVTNLSFSFLKADGTTATTVEDVKSVQ